jgi:hypothetical protein
VPSWFWARNLGIITLGSITNVLYIATAGSRWRRQAARALDERERRRARLLRQPKLLFGKRQFAV